jgi:biopolymer transport protein TolR
MSMAVGGGGKGSMSDINMTPMIDVLLVLLVIFMLAQPLLQRSIDVQLPIETETPESEPAPQIVLEINDRGDYFLNLRPVPKDQLAQRLQEIYAARPDKVLFVKASGEVLYQDVVTVMDAARGAGVEVLGAMLPTPAGTVTPTATPTT